MNSRDKKRFVVCCGFGSDLVQFDSSTRLSTFGKGVDIFRSNDWGLCFVVNGAEGEVVIHAGLPVDYNYPVEISTHTKNTEEQNRKNRIAKNMLVNRISKSYYVKHSDLVVENYFRFAVIS